MEDPQFYADGDSYLQPGEGGNMQFPRNRFLTDVDMKLSNIPSL
jgi:hypothetical protein